MMTRERALEVLHKINWHQSNDVDPFEKAEALQVAEKALEPPNPFLQELERVRDMRFGF